MLGMNWPGKLITTQESIHDTEGTVVLTAVLISDSLNWATVTVSSHKPFLARTQLKAPDRNFLQICLISVPYFMCTGSKADNQLNRITVILKSTFEFYGDLIRYMIYQWHSFLFLLMTDVLWSNDNASHCGVRSCCSATGAAVEVRKGVSKWNNYKAFFNFL